jgi:hypothetical protein
MCMDTIIETEEYKGHEIEIHYDESPVNPREEWDNLGTMVCWHSRYSLGDKHNYYFPEDFIKEINDKNAIVLLVYLYEHSSIALYTSGFGCEWDSGQVGFIYITKEKAREEYNWKYITRNRMRKIQEYLKNEVEIYSKYVNGEVCGYMINSDINDSCWGYFSTDEAITAAKEIIDYHEEQKEELYNHESGCIPFIAFN